MAERFTGFWEARGPDVDEVATTVRYESADELLERIRLRLEAAPPGAHIRIDLIAWDGEE
jgi:hypothetical protein